MSRAAFRQRELERILKAAKQANGIVEIDLRTLVATIRFPADSRIEELSYLALDGPERWDE